MHSLARTAGPGPPRRPPPSSTALSVGGAADWIISVHLPQRRGARICARGCAGSRGHSPGESAAWRPATMPAPTSSRRRHRPCPWPRWRAGSASPPRPCAPGTAARAGPQRAHRRSAPPLRPRRPAPAGGHASADPGGGRSPTRRRRPWPASRTTRGASPRWPCSPPRAAAKRRRSPRRACAPRSPSGCPHPPCARSRGATARGSPVRASPGRPPPVRASPGPAAAGRTSPPRPPRRVRSGPRLPPPTSCRGSTATSNYAGSPGRRWCWTRTRSPGS